MYRKKTRKKNKKKRKKRNKKRNRVFTSFIKDKMFRLGEAKTK